MSSTDNGNIRQQIKEELERQRADSSRIPKTPTCKLLLVGPARAGKSTITKILEASDYEPSRPECYCATERLERHQFGCLQVIDTPGFCNIRPHLRKSGSNDKSTMQTLEDEIENADIIAFVFSVQNVTNEAIDSMCMFRSKFSHLKDRMMLVATHAEERNESEKNKLIDEFFLHQKVVKHCLRDFFKHGILFFGSLRYESFQYNNYKALMDEHRNVVQMREVFINKCLEALRVNRSHANSSKSRFNISRWVAVIIASFIILFGILLAVTWYSEHKPNNSSITEPDPTEIQSSNNEELQFPILELELFDQNNSIERLIQSQNSDLKQILLFFLEKVKKLENEKKELQDRVTKLESKDSLSASEIGDNNEAAMEDDISEVTGSNDIQQSILAQIDGDLPIDLETMKNHIKSIIRKDNKYPFEKCIQRNLFIVGRTGTGKSTISKMLQDPCYIPDMPKLFAQTREVIVNRIAAARDGQIFYFNIIDSPGFYDNTIERHQQLTNERIQKYINDCITKDITDIHAFAFVFKYNNDINIQDIQSMILIKTCYPHLTDYFILLVTHCEEKSMEERNNFVENYFQHQQAVKHKLKEFFKLGVYFTGCLRPELTRNPNMPAADTQARYIIEMRQKLLDFLVSREERFNIHYRPWRITLHHVAIISITILILFLLYWLSKYATVVVEDEDDYWMVL